MPSRPIDPRLHTLSTTTREHFRRLYDEEPAFLVAAPGRVNLIGEHTDYNDGFVLPVAIDRHVVVAASPRRDRFVRLYAADFDQASTFSLDDIEHDSGTRWSNYERGVAWALQEAGYRLPGMDIVLSSDVPIGSGLSSSAAIEVATAFAFQQAGNLSLDGVQRALLCQKAENEFVGMRCGIMDQYIISLGKRDHALLIDCRSLDYQLVPIPAGCALVVCDTNKRRGLVDSEYNTRRQECEEGARLLGVPALRDISVDAFRAREAELPPTIRMHCRHVVTENQRVLDAVAALRAGELAQFGDLMNASHISLRDDYQVSCAELDAMVEVAWEQQGVLGARMTGAGFGGCTVNLVLEQAAAHFQHQVAQGYTAITDLQPEIYVCKAEEGVRLID
ncbi:MAG: galactokinase [Chloroflexi bacterium]|nr:galactokinase [Chloroflexota bacterium]